jgi:hypothetical protein
MSSETIFGTANVEVLIQEYLRGVEYVIDSFSYRGMHKVTAFWKYDKRPVNEAQFVYFGLRLLDGENFSGYHTSDKENTQRENIQVASNTEQSESNDINFNVNMNMNVNVNLNVMKNQKQYIVKNSEQSKTELNDLEMIQKITQYTHKCLDALGIRNGPSHAELIWLEDENQPCLVEVGARSHGGEGTFMELTEKAIGYNQITLSHDILFEDETKYFLSKIPLFPKKLKKYAIDLCMVSYEEGIFEGFVPGALEIIQNLPSFHSMEIFIKPGIELHKTIDLITSPGCIQLLHNELTVIEDDYQTIHNLERKVGSLYQVRRKAEDVKGETKDTNVEIPKSIHRSDSKELCERKSAYGDDEIVNPL